MTKITPLQSQLQFAIAWTQKMKQQSHLRKTVLLETSIIWRILVTSLWSTMTQSQLSFIQIFLWMIFHHNESRSSLKHWISFMTWKISLILISSSTLQVLIHISSEGLYVLSFTVISMSMLSTKKTSACSKKKRNRQLKWNKISMFHWIAWIMLSFLLWIESCMNQNLQWKSTLKSILRLSSLVPIGFRDQFQTWTDGLTLKSLDVRRTSLLIFKS